MRVILIGDINGNDTPLYYPDDKEYTIFNCNWHQEIGLCGELTFDVPKDNPKYSDLEEYKVITLQNNGKEEWRGFIKSLKENSDKQSMNVYCVEDLAWMRLDIAPVQQNVDRATKLQAVISEYNSMFGVSGTVKIFEAGYVINGGTGVWQADYETDMLDALRGLAGDNQYVRVRRHYDNNNVLHRYVDFVTLSQFGISSRQKIEFGENLRDFIKELNTSWMVNVINPYGAEIEGQEIYEGLGQRLKGTSYTNTASVSKYGRIEKNIIFEDTTISSLNNHALDYLDQNADPRLTIELSAIDLSQAGYNTDELHLGDKVRVIAQPYNIDQYVYITDLDGIDIQDLSKNIITLSSTVTTGRKMTDQTIKIAKDITKKIPDTTSILNAAKANSIAILDGTNGGTIYFKFNDDGQIIEQGFTDNVDIEHATKISRWNLNGKAILTRENTSDPWTVKTAETIDGQIVADFITLGALTANIIKTGTFTVGGSDQNQQPEIIVKDEHGTIIGSWTKDGITITGGTITINGYAKTSDIPDVSGYATKSGLGTEGYTIIDAGNVSTGEMLANRIKGGQLTLGGNNNVNGEFILKDGSGNIIVHGSKDGLETTKLIATDNCVFGNLNVGKKNVRIGDVSVPSFYLYSNINAKQYLYQELSSISSDKTYYFFVCPYADGWVEKGYMYVNALCDERSGTHYNSEICRVNRQTWSSSNGWTTESYKRFNAYNEELDDKDPDWPEQSPTSTTIYRFEVIVKYYSWALNYEIDIYAGGTKTFSCDANETVGTFRGKVTGSGNFELFELDDDFEYNSSEGKLIGNNSSIVIKNSTGRTVSTSDKSKITHESYDSSNRLTDRTILSNDSLEIYYHDYSGSNEYEMDVYNYSITRYKNGSGQQAQFGTSDKRAKENIEPLDPELSKNFIDLTQPKRFKYKKIDGVHYGILAQDARELLDSLGENESELEHSMGLPEEKTGIKDQRTIDYNEYTAHLINYVKFLRAENEARKAEIEALRAEINGIKQILEERRR